MRYYKSTWADVQIPGLFRTAHVSLSCAGSTFSQLNQFPSSTFMAAVFRLWHFWLNCWGWKPSFLWVFYCSKYTVCSQQWHYKVHTYMVHVPRFGGSSGGCEFLELLQSFHGPHGVPVRLGICLQEKSVTSYLAIKERPLLTLVCHPSSPVAIPHSDPRLRKHLHRPCKLPVFCLFASNFEVKISMHIIYGYTNYIPRVYNDGHDNPVYNTQKHGCVLYTAKYGKPQAYSTLTEKWTLSF